MKNTKDRLLKPTLPSINSSKENEKTSPDEIFVERRHRTQMFIRAKEMEEEVRAMGFKIYRSEP